MIGRRQEINLQLQQLTDAVLILVGLLLGHALRVNVVPLFWPNLPEIPAFSESYWIASVVCPFWPLFLEQQGHYRHVLSKTYRDLGRGVGKSLVWVILMIGLCETLLRWRSHSRLAMVLGISLAGILILSRWYFHRQIARKRSIQGPLIDRDRVLLAGNFKDLKQMSQGLELELRAEIEVVGHFDLVHDSLDNLIELLHQKSVNRVVFSMHSTPYEKIEQAVQACEIEGVECWIEANLFQTAIARPSFDVLGNRLMVVFKTTPTFSWSLWLKFLMDRVGATLILVLSSPLWLIAAIGIKLSSPGPVFFTQQRAGRNGQPFAMVKFRTMRSDAEVVKQQLQAQNEMTGPVFKLQNDPRIFKFGKWLRKLSIDELPQLLNIIRGEMSLVGPRPLPIYEIERIEKRDQRRRLSMKPGLTCIWQVSGRNQITSFEDWVAMDLKYIDNWSLWLDIKLLLKTIPAVLFGVGAK